MAAMEKGIVTVPSRGSVEQTVERLKVIFDSQHIRLFAAVDHAREAKKAGMSMPPTQLLIFGNPVAGTPLMLAAPSIALDLPLKLLVWEDAERKAWISYNSAEYLQVRHGLPVDMMKALRAVEQLATLAGE